jgi:ribonuclease BN (tRNA processing enzyme)
LAADNKTLDLVFLGCGNAFASRGRAFSSFLLNGRYLFDCGPTVLQQLNKLNAPTNDVDVILISHFHADHFFGLPFFLLDAKYSHRTKDLRIVGPPGIEAATQHLLEIGYPGLADPEASRFRRYFTELRDGCESEVAGLRIEAARVDHVTEMECFAYRVTTDGRSLVYSGDTTLCQGLLRIVERAEVIVLECSCDCVPVHLSPADVAEVARHAPGSRLVVTHLDAHGHPEGIEDLTVAEDLARFSF